jgi:hypothetical protein
LSFRSKGIGIFTVLAHDRNIGQNRDIVIRFPKESEDFSGSGRLEVKACFIGFNHGKHIAFRNGVSDTYFPFGKDAALNRLSLARHDDRCGHKYYILLISIYSA